MADSEVRQKFEAFAKLEMGKYPSLYDLPDPFKIGPEDEYFEDAVAFALAAWRAGEIAMKEKAANLASDLWEADDNPCAYPICSEVPAMIRALPLSGAEEATSREK